MLDVTPLDTLDDSPEWGGDADNVEYFRLIAPLYGAQSIRIQESGTVGFEWEDENTETVTIKWVDKITGKSYVTNSKVKQASTVPAPVFDEGVLGERLVLMKITSDQDTSTYIQRYVSVVKSSEFRDFRYTVF